MRDTVCSVCPVPAKLREGSDPAVTLTLLLRSTYDALLVKHTSFDKLEIATRAVGIQCSVRPTRGPLFFAKNQVSCEHLVRDVCARFYTGY